MRFINDDYGLKHDNRIATYASSIWSLSTKISQLATKYGCDNADFADIHGNINHLVASRMIKTIIRNDPIIKRDNLFNLNAENCILDPNNCQRGDIGQSLVGLHCFDHGLAFCGAIIGGDGDKGAFIVLYYDGKDLRLFTPILGNKVNAVRVGPISNDNNSTSYLKKYETDQKNVRFNWNAIKINILDNIHIDYQPVLESHLRTVNKKEK